MPFTCEDVLDKFEKLVPDVLSTLNSFGEMHPWAKDLANKIVSFIESPPYDIYVSCIEDVVTLGSSLHSIESIIDGVTIPAVVHGKQSALIIFFGTFSALYSRYWFTRYEEEVDAYFRSTIVHELIHAVLEYYGEFGEELPTKFEDALSSFSMKFMDVRARVGWAGEAIKLAYHQNKLKLFGAESDFREWLLNLVPKLDIRKFKEGGSVQIPKQKVVVNMSEDENPKCRAALLAAMELLQEECEGVKGKYIAMGDGVMVYIPKEFMDEIEQKTGHRVGNPLTPGTEEFNKAINTCVKESVWADRLARKLLGEDAPKKAIESLKRKLCERLLT